MHTVCKCRYYSADLLIFVCLQSAKHKKRNGFIWNEGGTPGPSHFLLIFVCRPFRATMLGKLLFSRGYALCAHPGLYSARPFGALPNNYRGLIKVLVVNHPPSRRRCARRRSCVRRDRVQDSRPGQRRGCLWRFRRNSRAWGSIRGTSGRQAG